LKLTNKTPACADVRAGAALKIKELAALRLSGHRTPSTSTRKSRSEATRFWLPRRPWQKDVRGALKTTAHRGCQAVGRGAIAERAKAKALPRSLRPFRFHVFTGAIKALQRPLASGLEF